MGGRQSAWKKKNKGKPVCCSRNQTRVPARSCKQTCLARRTENGDAMTAGGHKLLVAKLEEIESTADEPDPRSPEIERDVSQGTSSGISSTMTVNKARGTRSGLTTCAGNSVESIADFLERVYKIDHEERPDAAECNERKPHLHSLLNGVPVILKRVDSFTTRSEDEEPKNNHHIAGKSLHSSSQSEHVKKKPCDLGKANSTNKHARIKKTAATASGGERVSGHTSPMAGIRSVSTSPCSHSKECLGGHNSSPRRKCNKKHECVEKCATSESLQMEKSTKRSVSTSRRSKARAIPKSENLPSTQGTTVKPAKTKSNEKEQKTKSKRSNLFMPSVMAMKSKLLSDASNVPGHSWYGQNAYAFNDEEPKPSRTFNSENTARKRKKTKRKVDGEQKLLKGINKDDEVTIASVTTNFEESPFVVPEAAETVKEEEEHSVSKSTSRAWGPEYMTYSALCPVSMKCLAGQSNCSVLHTSRTNPTPSWMYSFPLASSKNSLSSLPKEPFQKTTLQSFNDPYNGLCKADFFVAPFHVPKIWQIWHKNSMNSQKERSGTTTTQEESNEKMLLIARMPAPRSNEQDVQMGTKTVITVRENASPRRYSDNCGAEEITPPRSKVMPADLPSLDQRACSSGGCGVEWSETRRDQGVLVQMTDTSEIRSSHDGSKGVWRRPKQSNKFLKSSTSTSLKDRKKSTKELRQPHELQSEESAKVISRIRRSPNDVDLHCDWTSSTSQHSCLSGRPNIQNRPEGKSCCASKPTRYCAYQFRTTQHAEKKARCSSSSKQRRESKTEESGKRSYKERLRKFFSRKSKQDQNKLRLEVCSRMNISSVKSSGCDQSSLVCPMVNKMTSTTGSATSLWKVEKGTVVSAKSSCTAACQTLDYPDKPEEKEKEVRAEAIARKDGKNKTWRSFCIRKSTPNVGPCNKLPHQPCECPENPGERSVYDSVTVCSCATGICDGKRKKKCMILPSCMKPANSPIHSHPEPTEKPKKLKSEKKKAKEGSPGDSSKLPYSRKKVLADTRFEDKRQKVIWALAMVNVDEDGTEYLRIVDTSPVSPGESVDSMKVKMKPLE